MRALWLPVGAMCAVAAAMGTAQGWQAASRGETPVIEAMAARYLAKAGPGARATDCMARPALGPLAWLVVTCGQGARLHEYHVNRLGWLTREILPAHVPAPQT
ncbi:MAG TPA: hypothetical protein VLA78_12225 [Paracoccaceae bacterium]|nr:hypothetical protein [Paracoccaceae bacterium]